MNGIRVVYACLRIILLFFMTTPSGTVPLPTVGIYKLILDREEKGDKWKRKFSGCESGKI